MPVKPKCACVRMAESGRRGQNRLSGNRPLDYYIVHHIELFKAHFLKLARSFLIGWLQYCVQLLL